jgi:carbohydrate kinase (thermoresistant glucokinase family)
VSPSESEYCDRRSPRNERRLDSNLHFILLHGAEKVIAERMQLRRGHFMNPALLQSQFATLESPLPEENVLVVDVSQPVDDIVEQIENGIRMQTTRMT